MCDIWSYVVEILTRPEPPKIEQPRETKHYFERKMLDLTAS